VKLKRLIVQGFKSFKDRTTIHFDEGITGIVGPNGCGKSNIVDALFWVMGEQSAKHLRGNSMKDVIFAGSSKFSPGAWAEATLVLGNDDGKHIHIGNKVSSPSEIQLTRKLYRNGETEYRINDLPCRLRDIQEVFMDTGAGAKSYSIIAQGEINRLVQAKPEERRSMIEEVAGITKFKMRKRESLKKIEQTQLNLGRLHDLQVEIEKNLKSLEKQAATAERARSLKEKIRRNDLVVNSHKVFEYLKELKDSEASVNEKTVELESWGLTKGELEISLQEERVKKDDLTEKIEELQKTYNDVSRSLAAAEERLNGLCRSVTEKEQQIEQKNSDVEEAQTEVENRKIRLGELEAELEELKSAQDDDLDLDDLEEQVSMLKDETEEEEQSLKEKKNELGELEKQKSQMEQTLFQNNSKLEDYARSLQDMTQEIEHLEGQYSGVNTELTDQRDHVFSLEKKVNELEQKESSLKQEIKSKTQAFKTQEDGFKELSREAMKVESTLNSLTEINRSLEGAKEGAKALVENIGKENASLFGGLVKCEKHHETAVQALLSPLLDLIVTKGGNEQALKWCSENPEQALDLLVGYRPFEMSSEGVERLKFAIDGEVLTLSEIVTLEHENADDLEKLLSGLFLVDEINLDRLDTLKALNFVALANKDGSKVLRKEGGALVLSSGKVDAASSVIQRNNQIQELEKKNIQLSEDLQKRNDQLDELGAQLSKLEQEYELLRTNLLEVKSDYASEKSAYESKMSNLESGNERLDILKKRKSEMSTARLELLEQEESNNNKLAALDDKIVDIESSLADEAETLELKKERFETLRDELREKKLHAQSYESRLKGLQSQMEDVQGQIERQEQRVHSSNELIQKFETEIEQMQQELEELENSNQDKASELHEKGEGLDLVKDELSQLLHGMQEREDEVKKLNAEINKNEKEVEKTKVRLDQLKNEEEQLVKNIFEKYRIDLRDVLGGYLNLDENQLEKLHDVSSMYFMETEGGTEEITKELYEFNRRYGQDLKDCEVKLRQYKAEFGKLGDINWQAIEDYERQKLRYDFLNVQEVELKKSLEDLTLAIEHIDHKSKERFKIAFEEVNERFQKVFPIIFGGGNAQLKVIGDLNDADCGVDIIAQPPGKKMQNINLMSGGEKAMTAVSLIFSIFLVKPSPFCLLDEVDAPLDDANVGRFNELLREMSKDSQFILITHNKKTMELNDMLYGVTMQEPGISKAVSVQLH
jgi:chromosome segregation protein